MSITETITKSFLKQIELALLVIGAVFIAGSLVEQLPNSANAWALAFRQSPHILSLIFGVILWVTAIARILLTMRQNKSVNEPPTIRSEGTIKYENPQPRVPDTSAVDLTTGTVDQSRVISNFDALPPTQKGIMRKFHDIKKTEIAIDDLFDIIQKDHPGKIDSKDELYYRALDLFHTGLIGLSKIGERTTLLVWNSKVGKILIDADRFRSPN